MVYKRNRIVDFVRGIAMLLVVLGHTVAYNSLGGEDTLLLRVIKSLQIPLFMLVSGYVTKYSHPINDIHSYASLLLKRTRAYILPWFIWGVVFMWPDLKSVGGFSYLAYHMDSGLWFLFTLWLMVFVSTTARYVVYKISVGGGIYNLALNLLVSTLICSLFLLIGKSAGTLDFLGVKYVLYYMPFYLIGEGYGYLQDTAKPNSLAFFGKCRECVLCMCTLFYILSIYNLKLFSTPNVSVICLRFLTQLCGCFVVVNLIKRIYSESSRLCAVVTYVGTVSLDVYVIHRYFLNIIKLSGIDILSLSGFLGTFINYILAVLLTLLVASVFRQSHICQLILFGKK